VVFVVDKLSLGQDLFSAYLGFPLSLSFC